MSIHDLVIDQPAAERLDRAGYSAETAHYWFWFESDDELAEPYWKLLPAARVEPTAASREPLAAPTLSELIQAMPSKIEGYELIVGSNFAGYCDMESNRFADLMPGTAVFYRAPHHTPLSALMWVVDDLLANGFRFVGGALERKVERPVTVTLHGSKSLSKKTEEELAKLSQAVAHQVDEGATTCPNGHITRGGFCLGKRCEFARGFRRNNEPKH